MSFYLKIDLFGHVQKRNDCMLSQVPGNTLLRTPVSEDNYIGSFFSPPISCVTFPTEPVVDLRCDSFI